jgi:hypothetical protein
MTYRSRLVIVAVFALAVVLLPGAVLAQTAKSGGMVTAIDPGQKAFVASAGGYVETTGNVVSTLDLYPPIPDGKRFVIESVGASCGGDLDDTFPRIGLALYNDPGADVTVFPLVMSPMTLSGVNKGMSRANFSGRLYSVGKVSVYLNHSKEGTDPYTAYCFATASGYLIDYK